MQNAIGFLFQIAVLIFSVVIHEVSHGFAAYSLGDPTAKIQGRLTLNPIKHLDFFGSFLVPVFAYLAHLPIIGWAKPVPYNPYNLKHPFGKFFRGHDWGSVLVGIAGPGANIFVALVFGFGIRFLQSGVVAYSQAAQNLFDIFSAIVVINLALAVFNLVPIPPLDGSKLLLALLPYRLRERYYQFERFGFLLLLIFIFLFSGVIFPIVSFLFRLITGIAF